MNYFDFINQEDIQPDEALELIRGYIKKDAILKDGKEPYPISLRGINWIKFLSKHNISDDSIDKTLFNHYQILSRNLEYHLLGNHLLENGFALLFGAYYFKDERFYKKAKKILFNELMEQTLDDGAHFELSPMYHQIILCRLMDSIHLVRSNIWKHDGLLSFLTDCASRMLSWLYAVTYKNGNIPMVNDSAYAIAPSSEELFKYARTLDIKWDGSKLKLSDSGYRKFTNDSYELFLDVGDIGPTYQPGHAHSDTFSFELYVKMRPVIVETGISTYEKNERRQLERATCAHNTVQMDGFEQSEIWGGFRVGKRARIIALEETEKSVKATHDGYKSLGVLHSREFSTANNKILISDRVTDTMHTQRAYIHFHPSVEFEEITSRSIKLDSGLIIEFVGASNIEVANFDYAMGFNRTQKAKKAIIRFNQSLDTKISL
ncbi:alginate lyase family protein [Hyunsoonleella sp. SJ7]|uniref:Alginate lyase family protein n=1 Tax=Hyunsoonleella aquatilis TaxID=2762758 RepID=A0A923H8J4_9FLAO|nr:alginate lyase family protein [Hyunsoonleella aquatilis]MBC3758485.1 alginate lyase family protein [Hyunsoonleella aquatilis]